MNNDALYNHFRLSGIPSTIAAQAADTISAKADELWLGNPDSVLELANTFIALYEDERTRPSAIETLREKMI